MKNWGTTLILALSPVILLAGLAWFVLGPDAVPGARKNAESLPVADIFKGETRPVPGRSTERIKPLEELSESEDMVSEAESSESEDEPAESGKTVKETIAELGQEESGEEDDSGEGLPEGEPDLILQAGFDMIYPNFNKKTGRRDPFVPVSPMETDWDPIKRLANEQFRVIGTALTPSGQIAMLSIMEQTKVVREGDIMENGAVVKSISPYDVILMRDNREMRLTMFTIKRVAKMLPTEDTLKLKELSNVQDLYKKYLEDKFGEEYETREGETSRPDSFNDYMEKHNSSRGESRDLMRD